MATYSLAALDWGVIALYGIGMLAVGWYYSRQASTTDEYLLGGRTMKPLWIGLSLFATLTSTLSYLAIPEEMVQHGPMMFCQLAAYPFIAVVVGYLLIPHIMRLRVTSAYEILERKLGPAPRLLGSALFLLLRIAWIAAILFATSDRVLAPLVDLGPHTNIYLCAALGLITVIYTASGGIKAVVVTDVIQSLIMIGGAVIVIAVVSARMGGVAPWWPTEWFAHWEAPRLGFTPGARITFTGAAMSMFVWYVCTAGADQMAIQRYLATRDAKTARRALFTSLSTDVLVTSLLALVGLAVLAWYTSTPVPETGQPLSYTQVAGQAKTLFPRYVVEELPQGLSGLVIAAMLSAAMSSLSSGMNSCSAVISEDFIARFRRQPISERAAVRLVRAISFGVGAIAVVLSIWVAQLQGNLFDLCFKVVNVLTAPLFVLFFMALFVRFGTSLGAVVGTAASIATATAIAFYPTQLESFLSLKTGLLGIAWINPASLLVGIAVGILASIPGQPGRARIVEPV